MGNNSLSILLTAKVSFLDISLREMLDFDLELTISNHNILLLSYDNAFEIFTGVSNSLPRKIMSSSQNETLNHSQ